VLALDSTVFDRMLFSEDFREGQQNRATLEGDDYEEMIKFLSCIFPAN